MEAEKNRSATKGDSESTKLPYAAPQLSFHGTLQELTRGGIVTSHDTGGSGNTNTHP